MAEPVEPTTNLRLLPWQQDILYGILLAIILLVWFAPHILQDQMYKENDNLQFAIVTNFFKEHQAQTGELAYWNPNPWGGIPNTFEIPRSPLSIDYYLTQLSEVFSFPFIFFLWGGLGMFFLARHLKFSRAIAGLGALLFVIAPYYQSLLIVGHVNKLQALMHMPWVLWSMLLLLRKPGWLHTIFFALAFSWELRSNHYQVMFYVAFLLLIIWLAQVWPMLRNRNWEALLKRVGYFAIGGIVAILISAEPLFIASSYAGQSVRGQRALQLQDEQFERRKGVGKKFIETWSFQPSELLTLIIPRAKGGMSDDVYPDAHQIGFRDGKVRSYWGHSPFNSTYYYVGTLVLLLLCYGTLYKLRDGTFVGLLITTVLMVLWSLGTFFQPFFDLCYSILPFFRNFRTPPTSLSVVYLTLPIMAMYGLRGLETRAPAGSLFKKDWLPLVILGVLGALSLIYSGIAPYVKGGEDLSQSMIKALQDIRKEMFVMDVYRFFILLGISAGFFLTYFYGKIKFHVLLLSLSVLMVADFLLINNRYPFETISKREFADTYLRPDQTVQFIRRDPGSFRVLPYSTTNFGLPAHLQTIGGGLDLQMNVSTYEISSNCLHHRLDGKLQLNWNVVDMLNVKYIVADRELPHEFLSLEFTDEIKGLYTYRYKFDRPRGFFVDRVEIIADDRARLERLNQPQFESRSAAILERPPSGTIGNASRSKTEVLEFSANKIIYNVDANTQGLFVMSDVFAPESQQIFLDGDLVHDVYRTNHMIQSIIVPEGLHTIELRYKDDVFKVSKTTTNSALVLIYLALGGLLIRKRKHSRKN